MYLTKAMTEQVGTFSQRSLHSHYVSVYLNATYIAVKHETVSKEVVYLTVDIREDGSKEILAYTIAPTESAFVWKELLLYILDGIKGITDHILVCFQMEIITPAVFI